MARRILQRPAWLGAAGAAAVALVCCLLAVRTYRQAVAMLHWGRAPVPPAARGVLAGVRDAAFRTKDGLVLKGWFAPGARRDAVVLIHGLGGNRAQLVPEAAILLRHGHGVLLYDSRASGESEGDTATWGDRERPSRAVQTHRGCTQIQ